MTLQVNRRAFVGGSAALLAAAPAGLAMAQAPQTLRFSAVFSEQDIRADMMKRFAEAIKNLRNRHARRGFDFIVRIDERHSQPHGQSSAHRGFAHTHQTDKHDRLPGPDRWRLVGGVALQHR